MASSNWTFLASGLTAGDVARNVSQGFTPPNGGGNFVFGFSSLTSTIGTVGKACNEANFYPIAAGKGASVRGALQRNGTQDGTIMLFASLASNDVTADGYLLGLTQDEEPSHIVLAKGSPSSGLISTATNILRTSSATYTKGTWVHIRLDVIVQPHGDVHLQVFANDLSVNAVTAPSWAAIGGMAEFIDDTLGVNSGSAPYTGGGYAGVAYRTEAIGRYALADHVQIGRQV
jgi:hypothetical protein